MIKSIQKALKILEILSDNPSESMQLKELSQLTGIEKSTCHHVIETLCSCGYVTKANKAGAYKLGPSAFLLSRNGRYNESMVSTSHPVLKWMAMKTHMTAILAVLENCQKFIIDRVDIQNNTFKYSTGIFSDDIYRTATGRILLAHMPDEKVREIYRKYGNPKDNDWKNIKSYEELCISLKSVRESKYIRTESYMPDKKYHIGYGTAVFCDSECVGAVGMAVICTEKNEEKTDKEKLKYLFAASEEITRRLNYRYDTLKRT